jgi:outer membrane lipopolysaccharide assembly protein LptE/RlpB
MNRPTLSIRTGFLLAGMLALTGCGLYTVKSGRTAVVSSIGIPLFENRTSEYGLAEQLTEGITDQLVEENIVQVVDPSRAESILKAVILSYKRSPYTYDATEYVTEYIVEIVISAKLVKASDDSPIWEAASIRGWGVYPADSGTEQDGQAKAIEKLTEEIINRTAKGW